MEIDKYKMGGADYYPSKMRKFSTMFTKKQFPLIYQKLIRDRGWKITEVAKMLIELGYDAWVKEMHIQEALEREAEKENS